MTREEFIEKINSKLKLIRNEKIILRTEWQRYLEYQKNLGSN